MENLILAIKSALDGVIRDLFAEEYPDSKISEKYKDYRSERPRRLKNLGLYPINPHKAWAFAKIHYNSGYESSDEETVTRCVGVLDRFRETHKFGTN